MKPACLILTIVIIVAILGVCIMVKYATEVTVEERKREFLVGGNVHKLTRSMGVIDLENQVNADRFPYVAAIMRNTSSSWSFACFGAVILERWVVTSAHCLTSNATHHVLIYSEFARNFTRTYLILLWRIHENYDTKSFNSKHDIAVAKLNTELYNYKGKTAVFNLILGDKLDVSVWKTVWAMDRTTYLTNEMANYDFKKEKANRCSDIYGIDMDDSMICVDMSRYEKDCFVNEFGPMFSGDKVIGVLAMKPRDCSSKIATFTNVSYYTEWILKSTH